MMMTRLLLLAILLVPARSAIADPARIEQRTALGVEGLGGQSLRECSSTIASFLVSRSVLVMD